MTSSHRRSVKAEALPKATDKKYGLAVKLVLVCTTCKLEKKRFSSLRVAGTEKITPFEVNMRAIKGMQSIDKGVTALADFCACMNLSNCGLHHNTCQGHLKSFEPVSCEASASASASEPTRVAVVKSLYGDLLNPVRNTDMIFDGSWTTRGRSPRINVGCIAKLYSGLILNHVVFFLPWMCPETTARGRRVQ